METMTKDRVPYAEGLGERLRELRYDAVLTLEELAEASGVHYTTIARIESGAAPNPHPSTLRKLADALGSKVEYLARDLE